MKLNESKNSQYMGKYSLVPVSVLAGWIMPIHCRFTKIAGMGCEKGMISI